ncbi:MAG: MFS transporter [Corynebacterium sp.]|uniref:MFS transporter n=1 Tax=unclassified Corynebacterium TaxID=2624378 RepID=UPI002649FF44|nr:aromatic acid/H+ symport family MFS transporter [Corynebacterium sp.]MDN5719022.1 aromatic acid/H+ symport family MFS transporter [Corynebacterium sp.]
MNTTVNTTTPRSTATVTVLCWIAVLLDGFDLVVLGTTLPSMLDDPGWDLTGAQATQISTIGLVGMTIGALVIGFLTDKLGRRRVLITAVFLFSVFTLFLAFTTNVAWFSLWRFLAGAGLGGALPTAISLVTEFRSGRKAGSASTTLMTGYHVGAVLTALLGMFLIDAAGWHAMFIAGAVPGLILAPALFLLLPESPAYLRITGRVEQAEAIEASYGLQVDTEMDTLQAQEEGDNSGGIRALLQPTFRLNTIAIWGTSFMGLLLVYGLNTWLPQIMRAADYDLGNSLAFLMVLNVGAVVGLFIAGRVADVQSPRRTALLWFLLSAVFLALLAIRLPLVGLYVIVFLTGVFVFSSQVLIYAFVGENHPSSVRATAMGFSAGIGRLGAISGPLLGGVMVTAGIAYPWGFFAFALVGLLGFAIFSFSRTLRPSTLAAVEKDAADTVHS